MYVTEDTTPATPKHRLKRLYSTAINLRRASSIVICDTAGHATPMGTFALVKFVMDEVVKPSGERVKALTGTGATATAALPSPTRWQP